MTQYSKSHKCSRICMIETSKFYNISFECRGCTRMKELEVELEQLRLLVVAVVGREQVGYANGSGGGTVDDKVG